MPGGRPPVPTALKIMRGNPGKRPLPEHEPQAPLLVDAQPPTWLKGRARKAWKDIAPMLTETRVLTMTDAPALALICDAWGECLECRAIVQRKGRTYESLTPTGIIIRPRPEVAMAADAWRRCMSGLSAFGMTPSARTKVAAIGDEAEEDPFEQLLKRKEGKG